MKRLRNGGPRTVVQDGGAIYIVPAGKDLEFSDDVAASLLKGKSSPWRELPGPASGPGSHVPGLRGVDVAEVEEEGAVAKRATKPAKAKAKKAPAKK